MSFVTTKSNLPPLIDHSKSDYSKSRREIIESNLVFFCLRLPRALRSLQVSKAFFRIPACHFLQEPPRTKHQTWRQHGQTQKEKRLVVESWQSYFWVRRVWNLWKFPVLGLSGRIISPSLFCFWYIQLNIQANLFLKNLSNFLRGSKVYFEVNIKASDNHRNVLISSFWN